MSEIDIKKGIQAVRTVELLVLLTAVIMGSFYSYEEKNIYIILTILGITIIGIALIELILFVNRKEG